MVYLIAIGGTLLAVTLLVLTVGFISQRRAVRELSGKPEDAVYGLINTLRDALQELSGKVIMLEGEHHTLRAEVAAELAMAQTEYRKARSAEERTRSMVPDSDIDAPAEGEWTPEQFIAASLKAGGSEEPPQEDLVGDRMAELQRESFARRHPGRVGGIA